MGLNHMGTKIYVGKGIVCNQPNDDVNSPEHYTKGDIETIDIIKNNVVDFNSYLEGNIIKYISRYRHKHNHTPLKDLQKAQWYLNKLIGEYENE